jgi:DMSO/TMAO reductase YedYZ heme-binding membrane subunit
MATKSPAIFYGAIVAAIIAILVAVYYALPGYSHILVTHDPMARHITHTAAFGALALICIVAALVTRPKSAIK